MTKEKPIHSSFLTLLWFQTPRVSFSVCSIGDKKQKTVSQNQVAVCVLPMISKSLSCGIRRSTSRKSPLDPKTNVVVMLTALSYKSSKAKITQIEVSMICHQVILANEIGLVSDKEADPAESTQDADISPPEQTKELDSTSHLIKDFNLNRPTNQQVDIDEEDRVQDTPESDHLSWHHQLAHLPFSNIKAMAQNGLLPARLQHTRTPLCSSCLYGKVTR